MGKSVCRAHLPAWALPVPAPPCPRNSQFQSLLCPRWGLGTPIAPEKAPPGPSSVGRGARGWALPRGAGLQGPRRDGCLQELGRSRQAATTFSPRLPPETRPSTGPLQGWGPWKKGPGCEGRSPQTALCPGLGLLEGFGGLGLSRAPWTGSWGSLPSRPPLAGGMHCLQALRGGR